MDETTAESRPLHTRPFVWLSALGLLVVIVAIACWYQARAGIRAMQAANASLSYEVPRWMFWSRDRVSHGVGPFVTDSHVHGLACQRSFGGRFADRHLAMLQRFPNLQWLDVDGESLTDASLIALVDAGRLSRLRLLRLGPSPQITPRSIQVLKSLKILENLTLVEIPVSGDVLAELTSLRQLATRNVALTNDDFRRITSLPRLQFLTLTDAAIDDDGIEALASCPHLLDLRLIGCPISDAGALRIPEHCPKLMYLELIGTDITEQSRQLADDLPHLDSLRID